MGWPLTGCVGDSSQPPTNQPAFPLHDKGPKRLPRRLPLNGLESLFLASVYNPFSDCLNRHWEEGGRERATMEMRELIDGQWMGRVQPE